MRKHSKACGVLHQTKVAPAKWNTVKQETNKNLGFLNLL
ncbi:hypothetical protein EAL2_808p06520 (plasmid) [Peptoclostridium acidaminophilum DSM 3953]|uniref:Uncharacterized protein n=1 Tax=Peptoclostridium acidaminophilum DSM 3953 TaxID=1286171 RepID=W8TBG0_PEPAC|nr:hypothetical protein EAL2_808p06520 [Peptoclostridium acidaminophilum DSM 3953]